MKKCSKCGAEFNDEVAFCTNCGSPIEEAAKEQPAEPVQAAPANAAAPEAAPAAPKTPNAFIEKLKGLTGKSKIILGACCAVVLIAIIAILCALFGKKNAKRVELGAIQVVYDSDTDAYYVFNGYGKSKKIGSGDLKLNAGASGANGTVRVVVDADQTAYVLTINGLQKFSEDAAGFVVSGSGNAVAYTKYEDDENVLYVYDIKSKKTTKVARKVRRTTYVISNNGKHICYIEDTDDRAAICMRNLKNKVNLGKGSTPVAVSDNGKLIYFYDVKDSDQNFCLKKNNADKIVIQKNVSTTTFIFNKNMTQVLFSDGEKTYLAINGKKTATIGKGSLTNAIYNANSTRVGCAYGINSYVYDIAGFKGGIVKVGQTNWYIKSNKEATKILNEENINGFVEYSFDGKKMMYIKNDTLYLIPNVKNGEKTKTIMSFEDYDIDEFYASTDLKSFYFVTDDDELYFVKGTSKPKLIAEDVTVEGYDYLTDTLYYFKDHSTGEPDMLYGTKNGAKNRKVQKDCVDTDWADGGYNISFKENAKDDDYHDIFVLSGYKVKNVKVKRQGSYSGTLN